MKSRLRLGAALAVMIMALVGCDTDPNTTVPGVDTTSTTLLDTTSTTLTDTTVAP